jgi:transcriptional regulator with XRE-family HTH domain
MSSPTIGARIRAARSILGMTQTILATKLQFATTSSISQWERDVIAPNEENLALLQKHLFDPAAEREKEANTPHVAKSLPKPAKPHTKEQFILSMVKLVQTTDQWNDVQTLLLGAKAQGYATVDSLLDLMRQLKPS